MKRGEAEAWLASYGRAWIDCDPGAAERLFSPDAAYHETPFDTPAIGRDAIRRYWEQVPLTQADVTFQSQVLASVPGTVTARWQATFTRLPGGERVELDGVFALRFDAEGLCRELREWWHRRESPAPREDPRIDSSIDPSAP